MEIDRKFIDSRWAGLIKGIAMLIEIILKNRRIVTLQCTVSGGFRYEGQHDEEWVRQVGGLQVLSFHISYIGLFLVTSGWTWFKAVLGMRSTWQRVH